jgi:DNA-binding PadR family transcriptional regulator
MVQEDSYKNLKSRFARSFMDFAILQILKEEPLWGYKLMSVLRETYGIRVGPSVIYPLLDSMLEDKLLERDEVLIGKRSRKIYRPTARGLRILDCLKNVFREFIG